jgi:hypothetical protein
MKKDDRIMGTGKRENQIGTVLEVKGKMALIQWDSSQEQTWKPIKKLALLGSALFDLSSFSK